MGDTPDAAQKVTVSAQATATAAPVAEETAPALTKIKVCKHRQRACDEKDAKGKLCAGHLKRWYDYPTESEQIESLRMSARPGSRKAQSGNARSERLDGQLR
ncbi:MAG: hypothetical protein DMG32_11070 [Acidobacteria bacterium]|nr:MAG: hypothetical protein DMG32_11070 [Acidobacteriota bacterium]